MENRKS